MHENFSCYQDKLCDEVVSKHLLVYISKAKKSGKLEIKVQSYLVEFCVKFIAYRHKVNNLKIECVKL